MAERVAHLTCADLGAAELGEDDRPVGSRRKLGECTAEIARGELRGSVRERRTGRLAELLDRPLLAEPLGLEQLAGHPVHRRPSIGEQRAARA